MTTEDSALLAELIACTQLVEDYARRVEEACVKYYETGNALFPDLSRAELVDLDQRCELVLKKMTPVAPEALAKWEAIEYPSSQYDEQIEQMRDVWVRRRNLFRQLEGTLKAEFELDRKTRSEQGPGSSSPLLGDQPGQATAVSDKRGWSDSRKWAMGIVGSLVVAGLLAVAGVWSRLPKLDLEQLSKTVDRSPQRITFFLHHRGGAALTLESVRIVSTQREGKGMWDLSLAEGGDRTYEFGKEIIAGRCGELAFRHRMDEIPTEFSTAPFENGQTRKYFLDLPQDLYRRWLSGEGPVRSRVEVVSQSEIVASFDVTEWVGGSWSMTARPESP